MKENMKYITLKKAWVFTFILWFIGLLSGLTVGYLLASVLPISIFLAIALFGSALLKTKAYKNRHLITQKELNELSKFIYLSSICSEIVFSMVLIGLFITHLI